MKKWMIVTLFVLLTMLLFCAACAEDGHKWEWDYNDKTHALCCNGCATHTNKITDEASSGVHTYMCVWPQSESNGGKGKIYFDLVCKCGKRINNVEAQATVGTNPTCTREGSHTYEYMGGSEYNVAEDGRRKTYTLPATGQHEYKNYTPNNDATCTQNETETGLCVYCNTPDTREIPDTALGHNPEQHPAKAATCTEPGYAAYEACKRCDYTTYKEIPAFGHNYITTTTNPTCTKGGYTALVCTLCGDTQIDQNTAALGHWYGEWTPNAQEDTHTAECRRSGCGYLNSVACAAVACKLPADGRNVKAFSLCPVCGKVSDSSRLMLVAGASATAASLPRGEVLVRMGKIADGSQLMVVGFEFAGQLTQAQHPVKVSLPAELLDGCILRLVAADGTEAGLSFSVKEGFASFSLDFTGAQSPVQLIHILPAQ